MKWKFWKWKKPPVSAFQVEINKAKEDAKNQVVAIEAAKVEAWKEKAAPIFKSIPDKMRETENVKRKFFIIDGLPRAEFNITQNRNTFVIKDTFSNYLCDELEKLGLRITIHRESVGMGYIVKVWFL